MEAPGFWDDPEISNRKMKELKNLKDTVDTMRGLESQYGDIKDLIEMSYEEEDAEMAAEIITTVVTSRLSIASHLPKVFYSARIDKKRGAHTRAGETKKQTFKKR